MFRVQIDRCWGIESVHVKCPSNDKTFKLNMNGFNFDHELKSFEKECYRDYKKLISALPTMADNGQTEK
jgi:hypothetical protein